MGSLLLLGITVAPFGLSWHNSNSYELFLKKGIIYSCVAGAVGILISLKANISIAASITFCITTVALAKHFIQKYKLKL
jgi:ABC-type Mn2+/Zn2+ transport system permease subunit